MILVAFGLMASLHYLILYGKIIIVEIKQNKVDENEMLRQNICKIEKAEGH